MDLQDIHADILLSDLLSSNIPEGYFRRATVKCKGNLRGKDYSLTLEFEGGCSAPDGLARITFTGELCVKSTISRYELLKEVIDANGYGVRKLGEAKISEIYACSYCKAGKNAFSSAIFLDRDITDREMAHLIDNFINAAEINKVPKISVFYKQLPKGI